MALAFWTEAAATFDLDVLVDAPAAGSGLVDLGPLPRWTEARGYRAEAEHVVVEGMPTQFVPSPNSLAREAVATAAVLDYHGVSVRVVRPEYLIALYLLPEPRTQKRRERADALMGLPGLNRTLVDDILERHGPASDGAEAGHAWPPQELLQRLRQGKADLHAFHASLPLPEKVRLVMELQRIVLPLIARQRPLKPWEMSWEIEP